LFLEIHLKFNRLNNLNNHVAMKKTILMLSAIGAFGIANAQQLTNRLPIKNITRPVQKAVDMDFSSVYMGNYPANERTTTPGPLATTETVVGQTMYPLQTNAAEYRRVHYFASGDVNVVYTFSQGVWNTWSDRGTGYNFYDGSAWGPYSTARIENTRTGFPDLAVTGNGQEMTTAHDATSNNMHFDTRMPAGTGAWVDNINLPNPPGSAFLCLWPRMAVGGAAQDIIYHIAVTEPTGNGGAAYHNQDGCLMFSKSTDYGATWVISNMLIIGTDSSQSPGWGGDCYAIDARGNTVVVAIGGFGEDLLLMKSTDAGTTWTRTIVQDFAMAAPYDGTAFTDAFDVNGNPGADGIQDTLETNDASISVLLDNAGMAHVFFGDMFVTSDGTGLSYFPGTAALMYWNEGMGSTPPVMIAGAVDLNANGTLDVTDFGTYQTSLVSNATSGIDASGNLYCVYAGIVEGTDDGTGKSFRNIYAIKSTDGGASWTAPYNISASTTDEKVYPTMDRDVTGGVLRLSYMRDQVAGHGVGSTNPDTDNQGGNNDIIYAEVPVADIVGVNEQPMLFNDIDVYPNPATDNTWITIRSDKTQDATISVYNSTGALISSEKHNLNKGSNSFMVDASKFAAGIYLVNVQEGNAIATHKLVVQ
jgi:hypothetical protein